MFSSLRPIKIAFACLVPIVALTLRAEDKSSTVTNAVAKPIEIIGVHNAFRVTEKIISGSQPEGDAAFAALAKLGVKTIVSVDGGKPDVESARKHGIRYVHLPIGYDGVPTNRVIEFTKIAAEMTGPFFVHCHHGKHRGPTAVAVMCEASEGWTANTAETFLSQAGTSEDYPGLYRAAREFKKPTPAQLAAVKELPEVARTSSIVDDMVIIDEHFDWLKKCQAAGWKTPPGQADILPANEATILWEQFRQMARMSDTAKRPADYRAKLANAEKATRALQKLLKQPADNAALDAAFKQAAQSCTACHKTYRNQ